MAATSSIWPQEHSDMLTILIKTTSLSFAEIAVQINSELGTSYTRNSVLGRAYRMKHCTTRPPVPPEIRRERERARQVRHNEKKKAERHAAKPWLAERESQAEEQKKIRAMFDASGASRTSREYRQHLPKLPEMSRSELRNMLSDAMRNTAEMEIVA